MDVAPWILSACAAAVAGAVGGTAIETKPIQNRGDILAELPRHEIAAFADTPSARERLPDHYPIDTPAGRIEVAELSAHGLHRNKRFARSRYVEFDDSAALDAEYPQFASLDEESPAQWPQSGMQESEGNADPEPTTLDSEAVQPIPPLAITEPLQVEDGTNLAKAPSEPTQRDD